MGWKGVTVMDQRIRFLSDYLEGLFPFTDIMPTHRDQPLTA